MKHFLRWSVVPGVVLLAVAALAGASPSDRPAGVPSDFIATPNGWFHPSCVIEAGAHERIRGGNVIERADGSERRLARCPHPHYDRRGKRIEPADAEPTIKGWVESASNASQGPIGSIGTDWTVPQTPAIASSQVLYYFPGLEPLPGTEFILQPVLAWNGFNDRRWTIASWDCCPGGNQIHSPAAAVQPGDAIHGTVTGTDCNATSGVCSSWQVATSDPANGASTVLGSADGEGKVLDWSFAGVLEAYYVDECGQYPPDGQVTFSNLTVQGVDGMTFATEWQSAADLAGDGLCDYAVDVSPSAVTLGWHPFAADCNGDGVVTIAEVMTAVDIALCQGSSGCSLAACPAADSDLDGQVEIYDLIRGVNAVLKRS